MPFSPTLRLELESQSTQQSQHFGTQTITARMAAPCSSATNLPAEHVYDISVGVEIVLNGCANSVCLTVEASD